MISAWCQLVDTIAKALHVVANNEYKHVRWRVQFNKNRLSARSPVLLPVRSPVRHLARSPVHPTVRALVCPPRSLGRPPARPSCSRPLTRQSTRPPARSPARPPPARPLASPFARLSACLLARTPVLSSTRHDQPPALSPAARCYIASSKELKTARSILNSTWIMISGHNFPWCDIPQTVFARTIPSDI